MQRHLQKLSANLALGLLLFAKNAHAGAPAFSCPSAAALREAVKDCAGNSAYTDAARACLEKYESSVTVAQKELAGSLSELSSADKQDKAMANAKGAYKAAISSLRGLAAHGRRLKLEVLDYKNEVVLPEDFAGITGTGFSAKVFLDNNPCYKSTQDLLSTYGELLDSRAEELDLTAKISDKLAQKAFQGQLNLRPEEILPMLNNPSAAGAPKGAALPVKSGNSRGSQSDITGTEKKKDQPPAVQKR